MGWHGGPAQPPVPSTAPPTSSTGVKAEDVEMGVPPAYQQSAPPPPPTEAPPTPAGPPPPTTSTTYSSFGSSTFASGYPPGASMPSMSSQPPGGVAFLPIFNQIATQRRIPVEYPAEFSGPPHAGRWTVKCVVNGIVKGQGTGASKQLAKEQAAKLAYNAMGWANRTFIAYCQVLAILISTFHRYLNTPGLVLVSARGCRPVRPLQGGTPGSRTRP